MKPTLALLLPFLIAACTAPIPPVGAPRARSSAATPAVVFGSLLDRYGNHGIVHETCTSPFADRGILMFARCDR